MFSDTQQKKANGSVGRRMKDDSMGSTLGLLSDELNSDLPAVGAEVSMDGFGCLLKLIIILLCFYLKCFCQ